MQLNKGVRVHFFTTIDTARLVNAILLHSSGDAYVEYLDEIMRKELGIELVKFMEKNFGKPYVYMLKELEIIHHYDRRGTLEYDEFRKVIAVGEIIKEDY